MKCFVGRKNRFLISSHVPKSTKKPETKKKEILLSRSTGSITKKATFTWLLTLGELQ